MIQAAPTVQAQYQQSWDFGLSAQFTFYNQHTNVNSPFFSIDPYTSGYLDLQVTQNLLYGFGSAVNGRNIRVQKNNIKVTNLQFRQQVATTVSSVLNLYWDLVEFWQDVRARQRELAAARTASGQQPETGARRARWRPSKSRAPRLRSTSASRTCWFRRPICCNRKRF